MNTVCRPSPQQLRALFVEYASTRDTVLRDRLVDLNAGIAYALAARFRGRGEEIDDLRQVALIALTKAVERFDPEKGTAFSTFATPTIAGALKRHLRDHTWVVRPPRGLHDRYLELVTVADALAGELRRLPEPSEVAQRIGCTVADVHEALQVGSRRRFVEPDRADEDEELDIAIEEIGYVRAEDGTVLDTLLGTLDDRKRTVVRMSYFADMTQTDIGKRVGVSQMHVSRLLARSLESLRAEAQRATLAAAPA
jgi:RNA polymerase sigma-B factor